MMFTLRSASARQILPSVPGLSSIVRVNSLTTGILRTSLSSSGAGRDASSRLDRGRTTWYSPALPSCKNGLCGLTVDHQPVVHLLYAPLAASRAHAITQGKYER